MTNNYGNMREEIIRISGVNPAKCMACGKCTGTCPADDEMENHPHQFVAMIKGGNIEPLFKSESVYKCLTCFACAERCPRGGEPAKLIDAVWLLATRPKGSNHLSPDKVPAMLDDETPQQLLVSAFRKYTK